MTTDPQVLTDRLTRARAFGRVAASLRSAGRKPAARAYDALIAASGGKLLAIFAADKACSVSEAGA